MKGHVNALKPHGYRASEALSARFRRCYAFMAAIAASIMVSVNTYCKPKDVSMDDLYDGFIDIICTVAQYVGGLLTAGAVISFLLAYKDDNADGQARAVRLAVIGIALVGFKTILGTVGII